MRVLIDTNIFISYLLSHKIDSFIDLILDEVVDRRIILLMPNKLLEELEETIKKKPYLRKAITIEKLERFLELLRLIGQSIPDIDEPYPLITRDSKDDYLVACAILGKADYLISGDKDLLVLERVGDVEIVHSGQFREILRGKDEG